MIGSLVAGALVLGSKHSPRAVQVVSHVSTNKQMPVSHCVHLPSKSLCATQVASSMHTIPSKLKQSRIESNTPTLYTWPGAFGGTQTLLLQRVQTGQSVFKTQGDWDEPATVLVIGSLVGGSLLGGALVEGALVGGALLVSVVGGALVEPATHKLPV